MGRLNSVIKFVVMNINGLLIASGLGILVLSTYLLVSDSTGPLINLDKDYFLQRVLWIMISGAVVLGAAIIGCLGSLRQTKRTGWGGRRLLSVYQVIMMGILLWQTVVEVWLTRVEGNLIEAQATTPETYGSFEGKVRDAVNDEYFSIQCCQRFQLCDQAWLWDFVDKTCPSQLSYAQCDCEVNTPQICTASQTYDGTTCCPLQSACEGGLAEACPYDQCRVEIIDVILKYITPTREYLVFVVIVESATLLLTCLLICYNPRDTVEEMLVKTGVLSGGGKADGKGSSAATAAVAAAKKQNPQLALDPIRRASAAVSSAADVAHAAAEAQRLRARPTSIAATASPGGGGGPLSPGGIDGGGGTLPSTPLRQFQSPRPLSAGPASPTYGFGHSPQASPAARFNYDNPMAAGGGGGGGGGGEGDAMMMTRMSHGSPRGSPVGSPHGHPHQQEFPVRGRSPLRSPSARLQALDPYQVGHQQGQHMQPPPQQQEQHLRPVSITVHISSPGGGIPGVAAAAPQPANARSSMPARAGAGGGQGGRQAARGRR